MMDRNRFSDAFRDNPYRLINRVLGVLALLGAAWSLTPWFPLN